MTKPAAFQATVHSFRTVPSRSIISITIECPIEQHAEIARIAEHGAWVAVARINLEKEVVPDTKQQPSNNTTDTRPRSTTAQSGGADKPRRKFEDMPMPQQAGLLCEEPAFGRFLREGGYAKDNETPAEVVRLMCAVESRKDIRPGTDAAVAWYMLVDKYRAWQRAPEVVG